MDIHAALHLHRSGYIKEAEIAYRELLAIDPSSAVLSNLLGVLVYQSGRNQEAIELLRKAVGFAPQTAEFKSNLAAVLGSIDRHGEALTLLRESSSLRPNIPQIHNNLGAALEQLGRPEEAAAAFQQAIALDPTFVEAISNLGNAFQKLGCLEDAIAAHRRAIDLCPNFIPAWRGLAIIFGQRGNLTEAIECYRRLVDLPDASAADHSNLVFTVHYDPTVAPHDLYREAKMWARRHADGLTAHAQPHQNSRMLQRRLRLGYVSADFRDHPVGRLIEPILSQHNHRNFEIFCYSDLPESDELTSHLRGLADCWRDTRSMSDATLCERIREDKIDILVDLAGHFCGNRLPVFARKPAPVQASHLGYCGTTGMLAMDYRFTDSYSDPPGQSDPYHTEQLIRLPHCMWVQRPSSSEPEVGPLPALETGRITFGNLNNAIKTTDRVVSLWSSILDNLPASKLLLMVAAGAERSTWERFAACGIAPDRLELVRPQPRDCYLKLCRSIDIALDPIPFNGDNSTFDMLWMGVPVITLAGNSFASRRGLSHLSNVGLKDCIAQSSEEYLKIALRLARDLGRLGRLRASLRQMVLQSPLCEVTRYVDELETAYREMWIRWCHDNTS